MAPCFLAFFCERTAYLRFTSWLQFVFVVAEPFVKKTDVFRQGADLLQPHFLGKRALYAEALVNNLPLKQTGSYIHTYPNISSLPE